MYCREHDKGPEDFCAVLLKLFEAGREFNVSLLGAHTTDIPGWNVVMFIRGLTQFIALGAAGTT